MNKIKLLLYGAGNIGLRILYHIRQANFATPIAFIESEKNKIGKIIEGLPVIDFDAYLQNYADAYILITPLIYWDIEAKLKQYGVSRYFLATDCPGEWLDECERPEFAFYLDDSIRNRIGKPQIVYGCNLFSLAMIYKIERISGKKAKIIVCSNTRKDLIAKLRDDFSLDITDNIDCNKTFDSATYITDKRIDIVDCFDTSSIIESYHNNRIKKFRNCLSGKRCFIIGNGPSLAADDLEMLAMNNEVTFAVNDIFKIFAETDWRPTFYVVSDTSYVRRKQDMLTSLDIPTMFISDQCGNDINNEIEKRLRERYYRYHIQRIASADEYPKFSDDVSKTVYFGCTVIYVCMQFALYMGVKEVYLLGLDSTGFSHNEEKYRYKYQHFYENDEYDDVSHLFVPYMKSAYEAAKKYASNHGVTIYNATRGGELEVFPRCDFDSLFMEKG